MTASKPLPDRLRICAGMIQMCEKISWGSDSALMLAAADRIAELEVLLGDASPDWIKADPSWVVEYIRHNSVFDADKIERMLEFAARAALAQQGKEGE